MNNITQINYNYLTGRIFSLKKGEAGDFKKLAIELFNLQYRFNPLYRQFCENLSIDAAQVREVQEIPHLPIELFKSQRVQTQLIDAAQAVEFTSSGTGQTRVSRHYVSDPDIYERSFLGAFRHFYGNPAEYCILALLPSYLERSGSSLVYMVEKLIALSNHPDSGFYLHDLDKLCLTLAELKRKNVNTLLLGVSYALLDLAEKKPDVGSNTIVMETGGMKGRRKELLKSELHAVLKKSFEIQQVHSEYGMTELLSQAYARADGIFYCPPWMQVHIRDTNDPFAYLAAGKTGGINVIDLANINSCAFIATQDLGRLYGKEAFEVVGRFDNSDIRGCNLMME